LDVVETVNAGGKCSGDPNSTGNNAKWLGHSCLQQGLMLHGQETEQLWIKNRLTFEEAFVAACGRHQVASLQFGSTRAIDFSQTVHLEGKVGIHSWLSVGDRLTR
jgi:hypothetical protein